MNTYLSCSCSHMFTHAMVLSQTEHKLVNAMSHGIFGTSSNSPCYCMSRELLFKLMGFAAWIFLRSTSWEAWVDVQTAKVSEGAIVRQKWWTIQIGRPEYLLWRNFRLESDLLLPTISYKYLTFFVDSQLLIQPQTPHVSWHILSHKVSDPTNQVKLRMNPDEYSVLALFDK